MPDPLKVQRLGTTLPQILGDPENLGLKLLIIVYISYLSIATNINLLFLGKFCRSIFSCSSTSLSIYIGIDPRF